MIDVGIVGCGVAVKHHLPALRIIQDVNIQWFCDKNKQQAQQTMMTWGKGGLIGDDFEKLISKKKPDVIHICTPPATHADFAIKALSAGCDVLLEKPMATSLDDAKRIIETRDKSGRSLCMMHNHLFDPPIVRARRIIEKGILGKLIYGEGRYFLDKEKMAEEEMDHPRHWAFALNSGIAGEYTPHTIYLLQSFFGTTKELQLMYNADGMQTKNSLPRESFAIQLKFDEALGRILMIDRMPYGHFSIDLYGTKAAVHINMMDLTFRIEKIRAGLPLPAARMESTLEQGLQNLTQTFLNVIRIMTLRLQRRPGHRALISKFYESLRNGVAVPVSGEEGMETVRTVEEIDKAMSVMRASRSQKDSAG